MAWYGGCAWFNGGDGDYYCENAMVDNQPGGEVVKTGEEGSEDAADTSGSSGSEGDGSDSSGEAGGPLQTYLAGLAGQSNVDCSGVCGALGESWRGMSMSGSGDAKTYTCTCSSSGAVKVQCVGAPFEQCCENECEGTGCQSTAAGWECPAGGGCPSGDCDSAADWKDWVAAHNIYRCMHNVPAVVWDDAVYQDTYKTFAQQSYMSHSASYDVPAPAGPAGENLFQGTGTYNAMDAVSSWYSEVKDCGTMPGCRSGAMGVTGHFTAMIWQGDKQIGCLANSYKLFSCRYKGLDYKTCNTPNFGDNTAYTQNVYPRVKTYSECKAAVAACGLPTSEPASASALDSTTGMSATSAMRGLNSSGAVAPFMLFVAAAGLLAGTAGAVMAVRRVGARRSAEADLTEGAE